MPLRENKSVASIFADTFRNRASGFPNRDTARAWSWFSMYKEFHPIDKVLAGLQLGSILYNTVISKHMLLPDSLVSLEFPEFPLARLPFVPICAVQVHMVELEYH